MSKTWRRDERARRRGTKRGRSEREAETPEAAGRSGETAEPRSISPEWAWKRVSDHAMGELKALVQEGVVLDGEEDIHAEGIRRALEESVGGYDPDWRGPDGKSCSPSHYCLMIVDRRINNIRRNVARAKGNAQEKPISQLPPCEAARYGYVSEESISDRCKCIRELWLRMDTNVLLGMLTPLEQEVLDLRQDELSERDIAVELGIGRYQVVCILKSIRKKARECGFFPAAEVKKGLDKKYFQPKRKIR